MYVLLGSVFIIAGTVMLASPKTIFQMMEGWKGTGDQEPSPLYCASTRLDRLAFLLIGIAGIVVSLLYLT